MINKIVLGVIVEVDGDLSQVGMYNVSNDAEILWDGNLLSGPKVGALLTINQNDIKIVAKVTKEKIMDQQNSIKSKEFDNRYQKDSINRIITLKTQGVIKNGIYQVSSAYVPMVGNEVVLTTECELKQIFGLSKNEFTIFIGRSIFENQPIRLSVNKFFASHVGIFGNTGSGKSNTLHKLYLELFKESKDKKFYQALRRKSKFFIIDFNGEYSHPEQFGVDQDNKKVFELNTRTNGDKLPIKQSYILDAEVLSVLFDAKPATQIPFLRSAIKFFVKNAYYKINFSDWAIRLLKNLIKNRKGTDSSSIDNWMKAAENFGIESNSLKWLIEISGYLRFGNTIVQNEDGGPSYFEEGEFTPEGNEKLNELAGLLSDCYDKEVSLLKKLKAFIEFEQVYKTAWGSTKLDYINPLVTRMATALEGLEKVINITSDLENHYKTLNIISLVHVNKEIKRLIPMLLSKMIYEKQKTIVAEEGSVNQTCHLIIDEAHNILSSVSRNDGDSWQDYRLSVFEEIIKEGRKFGFYLTLASQRPADISPTIMSQIHNYFIHRLVNENDLKMLASTMPTLDRYSYQMIPCLGQGEAIITGTAMKTPVMVKVDKEKENHPKSDDVRLTDLWGVKAI